jgi:2-dehydropantoate 2-reductase
MRIAIIGSGAMGGFYGAVLLRGGADVHFLFRRDYHHIRQNGLRVKSPLGDFNFPRINAYRDVEEMPEVDLVFVGLKTTANDVAESLAGPLMRSDTALLTAQNGLGNEAFFAALFGGQRIYGGLAFLCCNRLDSGVIHHLDYGHLHLGKYQDRPDQRLRQFADLLAKGGIEGHVVENLELSRWKKLIWNVPFNGLSTLMDRTVDRLMTNAALRSRVWQLMKELQEAAAAQDLEIDDEFLEHMMSYTDEMTPYYTSMHLDRRAGRPLELEAIIGEPLHRGRNKGVEMPEMRRLYQQLKTINTGNS